MSTHRHVHRRAAAVMWAGIASSALLLVVLLARGGDGDAWGIAAGVLLLICIGVCVWAAITGERSARTVREQVARLAEARRQAARTGGAPPDTGIEHHREEVTP